ncbi:MAG: hypothetical protein JJT89_01265 [Nitriliruptoraceae bacterium]|nr:hypothetical protein [Nitriliruptoraceae bacterium]
MSRVRELEVHRDAGPLVAALARITLPIPALVPLVSAAVVMAAGLGLVLGSEISAATGLTPRASRLVVVIGWVLLVVAEMARPTARLGWPTPAVQRLVEYGAIILLLGDRPLTYALLATLAFHHYDIVYRVSLRGVAPPEWLRTWSGGWGLRLPVLVLAAVADALIPVALGMTLVLATTFLLESITSWVRISRN